MNSKCVKPQTFNKLELWDFSALISHFWPFLFFRAELEETITYSLVSMKTDPSSPPPPCIKRLWKKPLITNGYKLNFDLPCTQVQPTKMQRLSRKLYFPSPDKQVLLM